MAPDLGRNNEISEDYDKAESTEKPERSLCPLKEKRSPPTPEVDAFVSSPESLVTACLSDLLPAISGHPDVTGETGACLVQECNGFNVINFGAVGDGKTDDTQAFLKAWTAVCGTTRAATLFVPGWRTFLVGSSQFNGPCQSNSVRVMVIGNISAPSSLSAWVGKNRYAWLSFNRVHGLTIEGPGTLNGQGANWWLCRQKPEQPCSSAPVALMINQCQYVTVNGLRSLDSQGVHLKVVYSNHVYLNDITIQAPEDSPNTDGINIGASQFVYINKASIKTGDDCISMIVGSFDINITEVTCGPGHGVSIGSLGQDGNTESVGRIHVKNVSFTNSMNGVRIKTWQGGSGFVRNVKFEQLQFRNTGNPIVIDQYYCPHSSCKEQPSAVKISEVSFTQAVGTSSSEVAINLNCSRTVACTGIILENVRLKSADSSRPVKANCINAFGNTDTVNPVVPCFD
ncbi:polygalacturonase ADPG1-like [Nymphaea colorata]|nr:polygalacturonase ADPG1-like [Nymphaea colorata]